MIKIRFRLILLIIILIYPIQFAQNLTDYFNYLYPLPNSELISKETTFIFKPGKLLNGNFTKDRKLKVLGSISGQHNGAFIESDDKLTLIWKAETEYTPGEKVTVTIVIEKQSFTYNFTISPKTGLLPEEFKGPNRKEDENLLPESKINKSLSGKTAVINGVSVPADYPNVYFSNYGGADTGNIFIGNWGGTPYLMILDNNATPLFYRKMPSQARDFKLQPNGKLTYRLADGYNEFFGMDSTFTVTDTFQCKNGYVTDEHEIQILPNGHVLMIALDYQTVDMSKIVPGGNTAATVIGNSIQELDKNKNVVFLWRSWDHFNIKDAIHENLTAATIDYMHMNAIDIDLDGNFILSTRHMSEITKIDRQTGIIIWRFGGQHNQFSFINDPYGFSYQHAIRVLKNGDYVMMDNGDFRPSPTIYSRAAEFKIDTSIHTATLIWEYRNTPDFYTSWMGNVQRLPNGNTLIDWADASLPKLTEVTPAKKKVYELNFVNPANCYRTYRFNWMGKAEKPYLIIEPHLDKISLLFNKFGDKNIAKYYIYAGQSTLPSLRIDSTSNTWIDLFNLKNGLGYYFRVTAVDKQGKESSFSDEEFTQVKLSNPDGNLISNGDFSLGNSYWSVFTAPDAAATGLVNPTGGCTIYVSKGGTSQSSVNFKQDGIALEKGINYVLDFIALGDNASNLVDIKLEKISGPYTNYSQIGTVNITKLRKHYKYSFSMNSVSDYATRLSFYCGGSSKALIFDSISLKSSTPLSVNDNKSVPTKCFLYDNYPNPFNPNTNIRYSISEPSEVKLTILDILGRKIKELVNGNLPEGNYTTSFNAESKASGIYFYMLEVNPLSGNRAFRTIKKMTFIK